MTRNMYDGVTPGSIPAGATIVAGYVNGAFSNMNGLATRFPHAIRVGIAVTADFDGGTVLDVEKGDATPAKAPGWVAMRREAGVDPTIYCNTSTWASVKAAFASAKIAPPHYWIADWGGESTIPTGAIARQWRSTPGYDQSSVAAYWPGVDPKPTPMPVVHLSHVIAAATRDPSAPQGHTTYKAEVLVVENALVAEGLLAKQWADGSFGTKTVSAYAVLQRADGYTGADANGVPGLVTLTGLGRKHGFTVVA